MDRTMDDPRVTSGRPRRGRQRREGSRLSGVGQVVSMFLFGAVLLLSSPFGGRQTRGNDLSGLSYGHWSSPWPGWPNWNPLLGAEAAWSFSDWLGLAKPQRDSSERLDARSQVYDFEDGLSDDNSGLDEPDGNASSSSHRLEERGTGGDDDVAAAKAELMDKLSDLRSEQEKLIAEMKDLEKALTTEERKLSSKTGQVVAEPTASAAGQDQDDDDLVPTMTSKSAKAAAETLPSAGDDDDDLGVPPVVPTPTQKMSEPESVDVTPSPTVAPDTSDNLDDGSADVPTTTSPSTTVAEAAAEEDIDVAPTVKAEPSVQPSDNDLDDGDQQTSSPVAVPTSAVSTDDQDDLEEPVKSSVQTTAAASLVPQETVQPDAPDSDSDSDSTPASQAPVAPPVQDTDDSQSDEANTSAAPVPTQTVAASSSDDDSGADSPQASVQPSVAPSEAPEVVPTPVKPSRPTPTEAAEESPAQPSVVPSVGDDDDDDGSGQVQSSSSPTPSAVQEQNPQAQPTQDDSFDEEPPSKPSATPEPTLRTSPDEDQDLDVPSKADAGEEPVATKSSAKSAAEKPTATSNEDTLPTEPVKGTIEEEEKAAPVASPTAIDEVEGQPSQVSSVGIFWPSITTYLFSRFADTITRPFTRFSDYCFRETVSEG